MLHKRKARRRRPADFGNVITAAIGPDHKSAATGLQHCRAIWLARRFRLPLTVAAIVADLHFGEATRHV